MKIENSVAVFQNDFVGVEQDLQLLAPASGLSASLRFYQKERADDCALEDDGDMLLFQWGTCNWGEGEFFELDFTRQFIVRQDDEDVIWQLSLAFKYEPTDELRALKAGNRWCANLDEIAEFETFVRASPSFDICAQQQPASVKLDYFCTG